MLLPWILPLLAQDGAAPSTSTEPTCPSVEEVRALVVDEKARGADFAIEDQGPRFVLRTASEARTLEEPAHDCAARAKMAAVALTALLAPPFATERAPTKPTEPREAPKEIAPKAPQPEPPASTPAPSGLAWQVGIGAAGQLVPGGQSRTAFGSLGFAARGGFMSKRLGDGFAMGATFGGSLYAPTAFVVGSTNAQLTQGVLDLAGHLQGDLGPLTLRGAIGPALDLHDVHGTGVGGQGAFRALVGFRAGGELLVPLSSSWAASFELSALLLPMPGDLALHSAGVVGKEPFAYLGAAVRIWVSP